MIFILFPARFTTELTDFRQPDLVTPLHHVSSRSALKSVDCTSLNANTAKHRQNVRTCGQALCRSWRSRRKRVVTVTWCALTAMSSSENVLSSDAASCRGQRLLHPNTSYSLLPAVMAISCRLAESCHDARGRCLLLNPKRITNDILLYLLCK